MSFVKIYLNPMEREEIEKFAEDEGVSISTYIKNKLQLKSASRISQILSRTIELAETLPDGEFIVPDLYSGIDWGNLAKEVNLGQLGKQFYEQVERGNVKGVSYKGVKNRKALYQRQAAG